MNVIDRLHAAAAEGLEANLSRFLRFRGNAYPLELQALDVTEGRYTSERYAHARTEEEAVTLAHAADEAGAAQGLYILVNDIDPAIATRAEPGRWHDMKKGKSTVDSEIRRRWALFVDVDWNRAKGTSTTETELAAALDRAMNHVAPILASVIGWEPIGVGHSGNGGSVFVALDGIPETPELAETIKTILACLDVVCSDTEVRRAPSGTRPPGVHVDKSVSEAKRLCPCFGTVKRKGAAGVPERPHRRTAFVCAEHVRRLDFAWLCYLRDKLLAALTLEQRAEVEGRRPTQAKPSPARAESPFARANAVPIAEVLDWLDLAGPKCPGCGEPAGVLIADATSGLRNPNVNGLKCMHSRCADKGRDGYRSVIDVVCEARGVEPAEAVRLLAEKFGFDAGTIRPRRVVKRERLEALAKKWRKAKSDTRQDLGAALERVCKGESFATPDEREEILERLTEELAIALPSADPASLAAHFTTSLDLMAREAPNCPSVGVVREKLASAIAGVDGTLDVRAFWRGDHAEIADRLLEELAPERERVVQADGAIWTCDESGVWRRRCTEELQRVVKRFAGAKLGESGVLTISSGTVEGSIKLARAEAHREGFFDGAVRAVGFADCAVTVTPQGEIARVPLSPELRLRHALPFAYDPSAPRVRLERFLAEVFADARDAAERAALLAEFLGACLVGIACAYEKCLILHGPGGNGKSEFMKLVAALFPGHAAVPPQAWSERFSIAPLAGAVINIVDEMPEREFIESNKFKQIVSGKLRLQAEEKFKDPFVFVPRAGHVFACNRLPATGDITDAFFRRFGVAAFSRVFKSADHEDVNHRVNAADDILGEELAGFAAWALEGAARLVRRGSYTVPPSQVEILTGWRLAADSVAAFVVEKCTRLGPSAKASEGTTGSALFMAYRLWAAAGELRPVSIRTFAQRLEALNVHQTKLADGNFYPLVFTPAAPAAPTRPTLVTLPGGRS